MIAKSRRLPGSDEKHFYTFYLTDCLIEFIAFIQTLAGKQA